MVLGSIPSWISEFFSFPLFLILSCLHIIKLIFFYSVEWLVLDESDKLFEDGIKGFKNQVSLTQCNIYNE